MPPASGRHRPFLLIALVLALAQSGPAALTGTMGFRPTTGRYFIYGLVPLSSTMDAVGPMARDVRDLALMDAVLTGAQDPELEPVALGELRIGVPSVLLREGLAFPVEWHFQRMLRRLDRAGVTLVEAEMPGLGMDSLLAYQAVTFFETAIELTAFLQENDTGLSSVEELVSMLASPSVIVLFEIARENPITEEVYLDTLENGMPALRQLYLDYLDSNDLDAVIYPTVPMPALPIGQEVFEIDGRQVSTFEVFLRNMHYAPLMGAPAVTLPIGQTREQLPVGGMDVMGAPGADRRTLAVAHAIAQVLPRIRAPCELEPRPYQF
ncbi:MAG: amidase family protein [Wenzhouxiangellaceae bacterium]|nr:amidase family protein [Wenzhouxiangellaceae bacterium]